MSGRARIVYPLTLAVTLSVGACADGTPFAPNADVGALPARAALAASSNHNAVIAELRRATARYHNVAVALAEGFVPVVAECEEREGEVRVAIPYANIGRLLDGVLDPSSPDALLYEPSDNGKLKLVGVEMVMPYPLWAAAQAPQFLGVPLQREDELGVFGLHVWIWRHSPEGMFSVANSRVSCPTGQ